MTCVLYNELEPYACRWLENLVAGGHIAPGDVLERSIRDLRAVDVAGYTQAHFFAGIGVWSYALRLAGWPDDVPVWTGSCPCQPFSSAGRGRGFADERHLWPVWFDLIRECRPAIVLGEQVANPAGRAWFDVVSSDLEAAGYAVGAADLCAAGVGAPHIRQRLYFVAITDGERREGTRVQLQRRAAWRDLPEAHGCGAAGLADADGARRPRGRSDNGSRDGRGSTGSLEPRRLRDACTVGDAGGARSGRYAGGVPRAQGRGEGERLEPRDLADEPVASGVAGFWDDAEWVPCRDGKLRPVGANVAVLVDGPPSYVAHDGTVNTPSRTKMLKGFGNAIVGPLAAVFIRAVIETLCDT